MYYTCEEIAKMMKVGTETVWIWIRKGRLAAAKLGKQYRVSEEDLQNFIEKGRKSTKGGDSND